MKRKIVLSAILVFAFFGLQSLAADGHLPFHQFAEGDWELKGDRLYQKNTVAGLAKVNIKIPQSGTMKYAFNVRYEGGMRDLHGGFGIHIFADSVYPKKSWGSGKSYLLWLNYDANPIAGSGIPKGFSAQVYKSNNHFSMDLVESVDLNHYVKYLTRKAAKMTFRINMMVDSATGTVKLMNPGFPNRYFEFPLGERNLSGTWIALRTNGMALSWGY